jgi:hypothetical protein
MNEDYSKDIGEEIISKLNELISILEKRFNKNGNELTSTYSCGNRLSE